MRALALTRPGGEEPGFGVHSEWRELVLRESQRRGELEAVVGACAVVQGERSRGRSAWLLQTGDLRGASPRSRALGLRGRAEEEGDSSRFLRESICQPFDPEWFEATWRGASESIACRVLSEALPSLSDVSSLYAWLREKRTLRRFRKSSRRSSVSTRSSARTTRRSNAAPRGSPPSLAWP